MNRCYMEKKRKRVKVVITWRFPISRSSGAPALLDLCRHQWQPALKTLQLMTQSLSILSTGPLSSRTS